MRPPHWRVEPEIPLPRLRTISSLWTCAAVLGGAGVAAMAVDVPLAAWADRGSCPSVIEKLCDLSEMFAHGLGVAMILVLVAVLDPPRRFALPRIAAASLGSGVLADLFKLFVARVRPHHFDLQADALDSFAGWFPLLGNRSWEQGFPSSHAATAAGLAIALAWLYPRGRWLFPALAALAGFQRVLSESHFLSDVFWGSAVGCIFAPLCIYGGRLARAFDRLEERLMARSATRMEKHSPHKSPATRPSAPKPSGDLPHAV